MSIDVAAVMHATSYKRSSIYQMMPGGRFPRARSIGARAVGWSSEEIQRWVDARLDAGLPT